MFIMTGLIAGARKFVASWVPPTFSSYVRVDNPNPVAVGFDWFSANDNVSATDAYTMVGAYQEDVGGSGSGSVYVFNTATGALVRTLADPSFYGTPAGDNFGYSLDLSDSYAVVGAYGEFNVTSFNGIAYLYNTSNWAAAPINLLNPSNAGTAGDRFGRGCAVNENYAIVGAPSEDYEGADSGRVYIYNTSTGSRHAKILTNPNVYGTTASDNFGTYCAMSNLYALVSAPYEDSAAGASAGAVYIYTTANWYAAPIAITNPNMDTGSVSDSFGSSVAISDSFALVGAVAEDSGADSDSGVAYVFDPSDGTLLHTLVNPNAYGTPGSDRFGTSVAISDSLAIVSAIYEDDASGTYSGKAYVYQTSDWNIPPIVIDNPSDFGTSQGDSFGSSVAITETTAVVGASSEDPEVEVDTGSVYIFK